MSYTHPDLVRSPKSRIEDLQVVYDGREGGWSLAKMKWDKNDAVGIRWNGGTEDKKFPGIGNPQSRGVPTWFILPDEVAEVVLDFIEKDPRYNAN